jgi:hypothetical protein
MTNEIEPTDRDSVLWQAKKESDWLEEWIPSLQKNLKELKEIIEKEKELSDRGLYEELDSWNDNRDYYSSEDDIYNVLEEWYEEVFNKGELK